MPQLAPPESPQTVPTRLFLPNVVIARLAKLSTVCHSRYRRPLPVRASSYKPQRVKAAQGVLEEVKARACLALTRCGKLKFPHGRQEINPQRSR